eukprot:TRINITY_DN14617_c0_g1_i1.p1 TRINITY_DN14617_c0_g1~~TRINITY_DN14617_c0_g1_i1.p1  ORF type:complete len:502 (-),score=108.97 TRINITY_DN14617_c0_g1_i1:100-1605(-)
MGNKESHSKAPSQPTIKFDDLVYNSERYEFPGTSNGIKAFAGTDKKLQADVEKYAAESRILVNSDLLTLCEGFLAHKRKYGTPKEQELYTETTEEGSKPKNAEWLVQRLIYKRPRCFAGADDKTYTRGEKIEKGKLWETVGTAKETVIRIAEYLTYDEIALAALIGVSSPTIFINTGNRKNLSKPMDQGTYIPFGIYTALVGARFERPEVMESQHMLVQKKYNTTENGYGSAADPKNPLTDKLRLWAKFYGVGDGTNFYFPTYEEVEKAYQEDKGKEIYHKIGKDYLNIPVYKKRMKITVETFLFDANIRAKEHGKQAYCHIVGLGLGEWEISPIQGDIIVDLYAEVIKEHAFSNISALNFSWFRGDIVSCGGNKSELKSASGTTIKIYFSQRDPADLLPEEHKDNLLVAQYAWDGNAWPGNEFWWPGRSQWDASGDPAAACCSTIAELQNPYINSAILNNIQVLNGPESSVTRGDNEKTGDKKLTAKGRKRGASEAKKHK